MVAQDILGSCLYCSGLCIAMSGKLAPLCLAIVGVILYNFRCLALFFLFLSCLPATTALSVPRGLVPDVDLSWLTFIPCIPCCVGIGFGAIGFVVWLPHVLWSLERFWLDARAFASSPSFSVRWTRFPSQCFP
jgi:hypothetical protein